jgi:hypothetical protein
MTRFGALKRGVSHLFASTPYKGEVILLGTPKNQGKSEFSLTPGTEGLR